MKQAFIKAFYRTELLLFSTLNFCEKNLLNFSIKYRKKKDFFNIINLYRSTSDSDLLRRVQNDLKLGFPGARRFQPTEVFIATWNEVGYYEEKSNKVVQI